ncbi:MAG: hypothetical protein IKX88_06420 [Thermoguttaceae bacterium]|nr:hypothetical protein [Thermoguttaceae bacterium]
MIANFLINGTWRFRFVVFLGGLLLCCTQGSGSDDPSSISFQMGDSILRIADTARTSLYKSNGSEIGKETNGFRLRYEDGKVVFGTSFQSVDNEKNRYIVTYEDGSVAKYRIETGEGFTLFTLENLETKSEVAECFLLNVSVPNEGVAGWINTVTLEDGFKVGVMTASINALPLDAKGKGASADLKGCSHSFKQISISDSSNGDEHAAEFSATSTLSEAHGWAVQGKELFSPLDLSGCVKLRARIYGDGKGEYLKVQLGGAVGHRDDYICVDFKGWKTCELDAPNLNDLSYDNVQRLNFYYNSLPANETVCCLIDRVEAVIKERSGNEETILLEDFNDANLPYWEDDSRTLTAKTVARHKIFPASCALIACSSNNWKHAVQNMQVSANIPSPRPGGEWRGDSPFLSQSYFFLTNFSANQYEDAVKIAKRGGFKQILILENSWTASTGHYQVNETTFPGGFSQLRDILHNFNSEGFRVGLHFLGASVGANDSYMTPVPDSRFVTDCHTNLASDISDSPGLVQVLTTEDATCFPVGENPYMGSGQIIRIDDELLEYQRSDERGLYDCKRGIYGTKISSHKAGAKIEHFTRAYGYHLPDLDTDFIDEIASNFASLANRLPIDMIYFDGSELLQRPGEGSEHWYYNARLHKAFYDKLDNKNILFQASSCSPYSWHMIARNASADGHDDLKAYLEERSGSFDPKHTSESYLDVGWYYAYDHNSTPDMYEYCLGATIGYDASFSFQTSVDSALAHPFIGEILDTINAYETFRLSNRIPDAFRKNFQIDSTLAGRKSAEERQALLGLRKEYRLETSKDGKQAFRRVIYPVWENVGSSTSELGGTTTNHAVKEGDSFIWELNVEKPVQLGFQVHFKEEEEARDSELVDPVLTVSRINGDSVEYVGKMVAQSSLKFGQYLFMLPEQRAKIYGAPLQEPCELDYSTPGMRLEPGKYRLEFDSKTGSKLPIRVRTPLYTDEIISLSK